ncbi:zinc-finger protein HCF222-like protein [Senna tora]|uniref:Zinc-finger protein HCF222-like protein n=1 Tax=Senna tora TaxID=362788 RepID=A0A834W3L2_9FABA|nr:zinc-finger protein HCF222-like protein [Senna tora]
MARKEMDNITASEIAGFGVGTLLLCATIAAPKIDALFSASQRSSLGMCKRCGNLERIACSRCRGTGSVREGGVFGINFVEDLYETLGSKSLGKQIPCVKCQAKGYFACPDCSKP